MPEFEQNLTPDMLESHLQIEFAGLASEALLAGKLKRGERIAFIVLDQSRMIFGDSNLHTTLEYALGINQHDNTYLRAFVVYKNGKPEIEFETNYKTQIQKIYGASQDAVYDYSEVIESKANDFIKNLSLTKTK